MDHEIIDELCEFLTPSDAMSVLASDGAGRLECFTLACFREPGVKTDSELSKLRDSGAALWDWIKSGAGSDGEAAQKYAVWEIASNEVTCMYFEPHRKILERLEKQFGARTTRTCRSESHKENLFEAADELLELASAIGLEGETEGGWLGAACRVS
ncbi:MAG: hypothetical protein V4441_08415 [Pseudomonadota bacterium]